MFCYLNSIVNLMLKTPNSMIMVTSVIKIINCFVNYHNYCLIIKIINLNIINFVNLVNLIMVMITIITNFTTTTATVNMRNSTYLFINIYFIIADIIVVIINFM